MWLVTRFPVQLWEISCATTCRCNSRKLGIVIQSKCSHLLTIDHQPTIQYHSSRGSIKSQLLRHSHQECWCNKRETWIFHSTVRKGGWQHQKVILSPYVRSTYIFRCLQHDFSLQQYRILLSQNTHTPGTHTHLQTHQQPDQQLPFHSKHENVGQ